MSTVLQTDALVKDYGNKIALSGVNLNLESGKIIGLLGSNRSGKTTLLKLVAGILTPTMGKISVCGIPVGVETKRLVSFLPERTYLNDWMRISEMLEFFADFYEDFDMERAKRMLLSLGVDEKAKLRTLSRVREKRFSSFSSCPAAQDSIFSTSPSRALTPWRANSFWKPFFPIAIPIPPSSFPHT